jgi:hypothetical protein
MSLIIKGDITRLKAGYPTVSDKYDVKGGILEGANNLAFGQLVKFGDATGYYKAVDGTQTISAATDIAGFRLAVNVKLINTYPGQGQALTYPGEAFDLCFKGALAVQIEFAYTNDSEGSTTNRDAAFALLKENGKVYATSAGVLTPVSTSNYDINAVFSGVFTNTTETVGAETTTIKCLAEIFYNFK